MKKLLLAIGFALVFEIVNGQRLVGLDPQYKLKAKIGIKSGLNFATLTGSDDDFNSGFSSSSSGSGLTLITPFSSGIIVLPNGGITAQLELHKNFAFQPEIFFQQAGTVYGNGKINYQGTTLDMNVKVFINYLTMSTLGRFSVGGEKTKFIILAGPYVAYAVSASEKATLSNGINSQSQTVAVPIKAGGLSAVDLGGTIGVGLSRDSDKSWGLDNKLFTLRGKTTLSNPDDRPPINSAAVSLRVDGAF